MIKKKWPLIINEKYIYPELISTIFGRLNKPHLKQKQNNILKQYETNRRHTITIKTIKTVRIDGDLNGNVDFEGLLKMFKIFEFIYVICTKIINNSILIVCRVFKPIATVVARLAAIGIQ